VGVGQRIRASAKHLIGAIVPTALFLPGLPQRTPTKLKTAAVPLNGPVREKIRSLRGPIEVVLDPSLALVRSMELPEAVAAKADAAIGLRLRQTMPGQAQGLLWRSIILRREGEKVAYGVYILKQRLIDELLADLRHLGGRAERVSLDVKGLAPVWVRKPASARMAKNWQAFSALSAVLVGVIAVIGLARDRSALLDLVGTRSLQVAELQQRRDALQAKAGEGDKIAAATLQDMATFSAQSRRLQVLADLTEALPDAVWVSELSISGDTLVLSGFTSAEVTDVINLVQRLPWAKEVQLNGAISFDSYSGQSRFELSLLVAPAAPI
jgi:general secretion pathway protein L